MGDQLAMDDAVEKAEDLDGLISVILHHAQQQHPQHDFYVPRTLNTALLRLTDWDGDEGVASEGQRSAVEVRSD